MSVVIIDSFNRTATDISTSPVGRWGLPTGSGGTNAWACDGQFVGPGNTFAISTRGWLRWIGAISGVKYGTLRATIVNPGVHVDEVGLFMRSHNTDLTDHNRIGLIYNRLSLRWELRSYTTATAYITIGTFLDSGTGFAWSTTPHVVTLRIVPINCLYSPGIVACPSPSTVLAISAIVDNIVLASQWSYSEPPAPLAAGLALYEGFGFEVLTNALWVTTGVAGYRSPAAPADYVSFDDVSFDNLITPTAEFTPTITADPTLTPIAITGTEGVASGSLPYTPDIGEVVDVDWFTDQQLTESGHTVTWARFQLGRRLFHIGWSALHLTEATALSVFLAAQQGPETPFSYVDDAGTTRSVYWTGVIEYVKVGVDSYQTQCILEEVL